VVALILAGNTPLLSWPALFYAIAAGCAVHVKMSRDETLWTRLFAEVLAEADSEVATLVRADVWPGESSRTAELLASADAVLAYGSDRAVSALRALAPAGVPFFGFGHAVSIGLAVGAWSPPGAANGFARDVLIYDQQGCLSPQAIFCTGSEVNPFALSFLPTALSQAARELGVAPVSDPAVAARVREARDVALFDGFTPRGDDSLRWTVALAERPVPLPDPVTHGFVYVIPLRDRATPVAEVYELLGPYRGKVSSVGLAGSLPPEQEARLETEGVTRICAPGAMQTPPLDWRNGGVDLAAELWRIASSFRTR
jgi:hypothetical protein